MKKSTLKEFITSDREKEKILIVRDRQWAADELDLFALDGIPSIGIHITTFEELLSEYAVRGGQCLNDREGCAVLDRVLRTLQKSGELEYYSAKLNSPSLTEELWTAISEIRMSHYEPVNRFSTLRVEELVKILRAYESELERCGQKDLPSWWREVRGEHMSGEYQYAVFADTSVSSRERDFLNQLPNLTVLKTYRTENPPPKSFFSQEKEDYIIGHYFEEEGKLSKKHRLRFCRCYLSTQEVRSVFEDFQQRKISPAEVEIVYADAEYGRLLLETARMFSVSVEMADGTDISVPVVSDWLRSFESFCRSACGFAEFKRLMLQGLFHFRIESVELLMDAFQRKNFRAGGDNYVFPEEAEFASEEEKNEFREFLRELKELVPESMFKKSSLKEYGQKLLGFLHRYTEKIRWERDRRFPENVLTDREEDLLRQLAQWEERLKHIDSEEMDYGRIFQRLIQMCATFSSRRPSFEFPAILVRNLSSRRPWKRKHCYLCGLTANSFPNIVEESSVLNDEERAALTDTLVTSATRNEEEMYELRKLMASFSDEMHSNSDRSLYFSSPIFDLSMNTEAVPSILPERWALAYGEKGWTDFGFYTESDTDEPQAKDDFRWSELSEKEREEIRDFSRSFPFSASSIRDLMNCPQCFYYKYVLKLPEEEEEIIEEWNWLDPRSKGQLCHDILDAFFQRCKRSAVSIENSREVFFDTMDEKMAEIRKKVPPIRRRVFGDAVSKIYGSMGSYFDNVLSTELQTSGEVFSEKNFSEEIQIGKYSIHLKGRIDHLYLSDTEIRIVDYKTGKRSSIEKSAMSDTLFQDMLYSEAMKVHFGTEKPVYTEYHFLFEEEGKMCFQELDDPNAFERRKAKIEKMLDSILEYGFVSSIHFTEMPTGYEILRKSESDAEQAHKYSDFKDICR